MRKREKAILCWLNEKEYEHLKKQAGTSGLTVSALIRKLIMGQEIRQRPPAEMPGKIPGGRGKGAGGDSSGNRQGKGEEKTKPGRSSSW